MLAVLAIYFVTEPAHEVELGLVDVTLARSVPRHVVVTRSLLLATGAVAAAVLLMAAGTRLGLRLFGSPEFDAPSPAVTTQMLLHLAAVALCFAGFGLAVATGARRWSTAFTIASLTTVLMYLVDFLAIGWPPLRFDRLDLAVPLLSGAVDSRRRRSCLAQSPRSAVGRGRLQRDRILAIQPARSIARWFRTPAPEIKVLACQRCLECDGATVPGVRRCQGAKVRRCQGAGSLRTLPPAPLHLAHWHSWHPGTRGTVAPLAL